MRIYIKHLASLWALGLVVRSVFATASPPVIRSAAELCNAAYVLEEYGREFDLIGTVIFPCNALNCTYAIQDDTGSVTIREGSRFPADQMRVGDVVHIQGHTGTDGRPGNVAISHKLEVIAHGDAPRPIETTAERILRGEHLCQLVLLTGKVEDVFTDEIDPNFIYFAVRSNEHIVYATMKTNGSKPTPNALGASVSITALCDPYNAGLRQLTGRSVLTMRPEGLRILHPDTTDPFSVPLLTQDKHLDPAQVGKMGNRRASGRVIALRGNGTTLLRTADGQAITVTFLGTNPPPVGASVEVSGIPITDLFRLNLSRATWRQHAGPVAPEPEAKDITANDLKRELNGQVVFNAALFGKPVRLKGTVRRILRTEREARLALDCGESSPLIDIEGPPQLFNELDIDCTIAVAGTVFLEIPNWYPGVPFPRISGISLLVNRDADILVLAKTPWWTPRRFLTLIGILAIGLGCILVWNIALHRYAERRGKELAQEQVAHVLSDFKVEERTHLAVELHDSLSQTLTGVSFEVETASELAEVGTPELKRHLNIAARILDSCRLELRNCLWDLRSRALEAKSMDEAIRTILNGIHSSTKLSIRFNVPRERFTDSTSHALLRIIRELSSNAVRHGHASAIQIAGCIDGEYLLFSVNDNGCGFNPKMRPGIRNGHFGLDGINERIERMGGTMDISSSLGSGTKVTIKIRLPPATQSPS